MEKRYPGTSPSQTRLVIDQIGSLRPKMFQCRVDIRNRQGNVMKSFAATADETADR